MAAVEYAIFVHLVSKTSFMNFKNAISWVEIPSTDIDRAQKFYETIFGITLIPVDVQAIKMRMFPLESPMGVGGAVVYNSEFYKPSSTDGPLIYLNANPDLQNVLSKVEAAGGKVIVPKTQISEEYGYMGLFIDTEGNRIGLHSVPEKYLSS
jgi:uncharacterized protein